MSGDKKNLLLLFDRPKEPVFVPKGNERKAFVVPAEYLTDKYKPVGTQVASRFGSEASEQIAVNKISIPDLGEILDLTRDENFTLFIPKHQRIAGRLINIFLGVRNVEDLIAVAVYARDRVNPYLFNYCLSVAILHRADTQDLDVPSIIHSFPDKYVDSKVFGQALEDATVVPENDRTPIEIPKDFTASDLEEEHRLAYFREDIGLNLHHWHWHLVYPSNAELSVVNKNRRGELFYYMHQQIMARYNFERLCNKMKRVERLIDWDEPIKEAYFPKLDSLVASRGWPARVENQRIRNLRRETDGLKLDLDDLKRWRDRIFAAINSKSVTDSTGKTIELNENEGIDILGNMVEASILSPNGEFYGNLHNMGHVFLSFIHDPDHRHLESFGVIGDSATAMRDPIFYRWHSYIDDLFQKFKSALPKYTVNQLNYPGVTVEGIEVGVQGGKTNNLQTFWQQSDVDLSRGMDFQPRGAVFVRFTHLQHRSFTYKIDVQSDLAREGTCRIFLAPKFDERNDEWLFTDQKHMFIELDKFKVNLKEGKNTIMRNSSDSSVTIPFERTYRDVDTSRPEGGDALARFNFCGCGWPDNLLIPKGTPEGLPCQLFVMISNIADDKIDQEVTGECNDSYSYCGLKDKLYPDRRSMGYPFDRLPRDGVDTLQQFLTPNMRVQDVTLTFENKTFKPKEVIS
ncbi:phenoloxidase 1-like isoform X2 [Sitophilus oryzae]|uniref:Phenoloxidase 1-like isoform X1 n=1 Tax=Sitophilus oryzae TaxID=7048 RepID=A0A6J2X582_SITOR|nr:phenoloxidase 1-like isoform X1 [Sitophilus oryzae]XP_030746160.1 phenoloxidase 1-like isoform X2 [Sitophilus oryzae]